MSLFPTHPLYAHCLADWREYRLCYEGGKAYTNAYLHKHPKEPLKNFEQRLERAIHPNHVRAVIDTYAAYLYKAPIARESESETLSELWVNMNLLGAPANEFYEHVAQLVQRGGRAAVVVDKLQPEDGAELATRAQELERGIRPYAYAVDTEDILNWRTGRDGRLEWIVLRESEDHERGPMEHGNGARTEMARVWFRDRWELYKAKQSEEKGEQASIELVAQGEHPCGEVPVVLTFWGARSGHEIIGDSAVTDLAPMNRRLMNYVSLIDEQAYQSTFSILAVPASTYDALEKVKFAPSGVIPYQDEVSSPPYYLSPDVNQIAQLRSEIDKTEASIRSLSGLGRMNADMGYAVASGVALSYVTMDKDALLSKFGGRMARMEAAVDRLAQKWMGVDVSASSRTYPTNFDPADLDNELSNALKVASLELTGRAEQAVQAAALKAFLAPRVPQAELEEILKDFRAQSGA